MSSNKNKSPSHLPNNIPMNESKSTSRKFSGGGAFKSKLMWLWNWWPPFLGSGIRIDKVEGGWGEGGIKSIEVVLKLRFWNSNYVGTQFGGSLFSMTDPFLMVMLIRRMGRDFVVWDKSSTIRFKRPGTSDCRVRFEISDEEIIELKNKVKRQGQIDLIKTVYIKDKEGKVVAEVDKTIYLATKDYYSNTNKNNKPL